MKFRPSPLSFNRRRQLKKRSPRWYVVQVLTRSYSAKAQQWASFAAFRHREDCPVLFSNNCFQRASALIYGLNNSFGSSRGMS